MASTAPAAKSMTVAISDRLDTDAIQEAGIVVGRDADNARVCARRELSRNRADASSRPPARSVPWRIQPSSSGAGKAALKMRRRLFSGLLTGIEFIAT
jgi:hypothetical protein